MLLKFSRSDMRIPAVILFGIFFIVPVGAKEATPVYTSEEVENSPVPFESVDEVPIFPGCEELSSEEERKTCTATKVQKYVNRKFIPLMRKYDLEGFNIIVVSFQIDSLGKTTEISAEGSHPKLVKEAERIVAGIPQMQPGKHEGKVVPVSYILPIKINIRKHQETRRSGNY